ncbi:MAG TPA: DNA repair protein RecN [Candidatus Limiplasma sp.]|nr:DNA repair protein RecN [Candidatus Limiplasma sp.]HRX09212.1 DNA repair protein RecN [Candidatus Limiplasma sp.]
MLKSMTVRNVALIEELNVDFHTGLHVLTGETGAGKSIVVDSINLVLGERADRGLIRTGCDKATVEAIFDIADNPTIHDLLKEESLEPEGGLMPVYREISTSDRNVCRVCGVIVPLAFLRKITEILVDIHGQHEHQSLLNEQYHMSYLDAFGDGAHLALHDDVKQKYAAWHDAGAKFNALRRENAQRAQRQEFLETRIKDLKDAKPVVGEKEKLVNIRLRFADHEKIVNALNTIYQNLTASEGIKLGVNALLRGAVEESQRTAEYGERLKALADRLQSVYYETEEIALDVRAMADQEDFDEEKNEQVLARLDVYRRLEKRYGMEADELSQYFEELSQELKAIQSMEDTLKKAETLYKQTLSEYRGAAAALTASRKEVAQRLQNLIESQLGDLGMEHTVFQCVFTPHDPNGRQQPSPDGDDHISFHIAPNIGEPLKPLKRIASGGEMSRIMLAMKAVAADKRLIPTMIFDEIDTGISGRVAGVVAEKMDDIARYHQVICVSHLPQIAAMADHQYLVEKRVSQGRTVTTLRQLNDEQRVDAVASLIGTQDMGENSGKLHARNMVDAARNRKNR